MSTIVRADHVVNTFVFTDVLGWHSIYPKGKPFMKGFLVGLIHGLIWAALLWYLAFAPYEAAAQSCNTSADGYTSCYDPMTGSRATGWNDDGDVHVHDLGGNTYRGYEDGSRLTNVETGASGPVHMWSDPPAPQAYVPPEATQPYVDAYEIETRARPTEAYGSVPAEPASYEYQYSREGTIVDPFKQQGTNVFIDPFQPQTQRFSYAATAPAAYAAPVREASTLIFYDGTNDVHPAKPKKPRCEFKAVMSDDEIALCRR